MTEMPRQNFPMHDPVTGVASDHLFWHLLSNAVHRAERQAHNLALLAIYVEGIAALNRDHGTDAGDAALRSIAERLSCRLRRSDTIARLGGTKFGLLIESMNEDADVQIVAQSLLDLLGTPIDTIGGEVRLPISMGLALYPRTATTAENLLGAAIGAMDLALADGGSCYRLA